MPVIDTDIHSTYDRQRLLDFLPEPWRTRFASGNQGPGTLGYWNPNGVMRSDAVTTEGERIEASPAALGRYFFDEFDIEYGILNVEGSLHYGLSPEPDYAAAVVSAINDLVAHDWLHRRPALPRLADRHAQRSGAGGAGDPPRGRAARASSRCSCRVVRACRLASATTTRSTPPPSNTTCRSRSTRVRRASASRARRAPPVTHPATWSGTPGLVGSYIAHLVSLITEGVFIKFPRLRFVLIEGGVSWLPPVLWRFDKNWKALRQTTPWLERPPSELVFEHVRLTTQPIEEPPRAAYLRSMLEMFPVERMLMFSSDFPHWDGDTPDFAARAMPVVCGVGCSAKPRASCIGCRLRSTRRAPRPRPHRLPSAVAEASAAGARRAPVPHLVGRVDDFADGKHRIVAVSGRQIGVFNVHGQFVAVLNVCPHELAPVCRGRVGGTTLASAPGTYRWGREGEILACPWHGWEYDLLTCRALADERVRLKRYPVTITDGDVYVTV